MIPLFDPRDPARDPNAVALIEAIRRADGIVIASPGYHGSISGLIKNALDYVEYLRDDIRPYFEGRAIGCIACASGWQATGSTLAALRAVAHALRGWPTPLGAGVNSAEIVFNQDGSCANPAVASQLGDIGRQVVQFARQSAAEKILRYRSAEGRTSLECANAGL
jgi:FMN reductase